MGLPAAFTDHGKVDRRAARARTNIRLALEELEAVPWTSDASEAADHLAAADTFLDLARQAVEEAFRGIDS